MLQYYFHVCMSGQRVIRKDRLSQSQLESNFEFCRRKFRGQRLAITQGIQRVQRGAILRLISYLLRSSFLIVFLAFWGTLSIVCQPLPPTEQSEQNGLSGPRVW